MQTIVKNEATPETTLKETRRLLRVSRRLRKAALTHAALGLELFARSSWPSQSVSGADRELRLLTK
jgi:hypothetical protein